MPSILPTHFPSSPNPHPSHPLPTPRPSAAHTPSAPSLLPFCPQPTPPSPLLLELVHLLPCLLIQPTCSLVYPSTRQLARYSPNLFTCYPVSSRIQLVLSSTRSLVNLQCYSSNLFICYHVFLIPYSCLKHTLSPYPPYPVPTLSQKK
mgnify:CR=1 FL=1